MHTLADLRAGKLAGSKRLDLSCDLTTFPDEIFSLSDSLEVLNLTGNRLTELPADLHRLQHLKVLFCSNNPFTELPEALGQCPELFFVGFKSCRIATVSPRALPPRLRSLVLTDNCLASLPDELGQFPALQKLMLAGNRLQELPESLVACQHLELVRIASNRFRQLPAWLLRMPSLAWLAFSGNPLTDIHQDTPIRQIPWAELSLQQVLGEGASGVIQQAEWRRDNSLQNVAVKLYKGQLTSDGTPLNEMAACIAAGQHPNLIPVEGQVLDHPEHTQALVMRLIATRFATLARPPSLATCTRDVYEDIRLSPSTVQRIAHGIASACAHLHGRGINHGDLYAHNVLWAEPGDSLLGDFGAAAFYPDADTGFLLQRIEVQAFGILLGELLALCDGHRPDTASLRALQAHCTQADVGGRPGFDEVERRLAI
ncbi:leucine-rich repeat-containing serine/threonine-protein kinase [Pseudomonas sp. GD03842]|uniref:leucine-rich repeat-containing protein kinase family protein n=1 Tax=Pseudomonas sp. GD03842 TaxID=2975385 RepID=UPI00244776AC|nr:leucine-rich repeat-containing protein kinase family protein [Pseudomonas sp. GD03842]MDH0747774.1 leucine-rich repeat-containing serine/threonine-protein kinase [Pseudomonas sp. GD03842]